MRFQWFWQPDKNYVNEVNTTNLRTLNGIRMGVFLVGIGGLAFLWATWHGIAHCRVEPCGQAVTTMQAANFAESIFNTLCLFVGAIMGLALTGHVAKRMTDTEYVERKERAKKTPVNITEQQVNVNAQPPKPPEE